MMDNGASEPANERKKLVVPCERTFSTCVVTPITELKEIKNREIGESCMEVSDLERERDACAWRDGQRQTDNDLVVRTWTWTFAPKITEKSIQTKPNQRTFLHSDKSNTNSRNQIPLPLQPPLVAAQEVAARARGQRLDSPPNPPGAKGSAPAQRKDPPPTTQR